MTRTCFVLGLLSCAIATQGQEPPSETLPARTYTNEDLARMAPLRHQTGALCRPAFPPGADTERRAEREEEAAKRLEDERYWRREAERLRKRVAPLQDRAEELRLKIAQRRREPDVPLVDDPQIEAWEAQVERLARQVRELELRLAERARRAGALPGWLR